MLKIFKNRDFYSNLLKLAIPIGLQQLIFSSLNLVDTLIVGGLGAEAIAAVTIANQFYFVYYLVLYGINSGATIFFSQYWGTRDIANIKRILGLSTIFSLFTAIIFLLGAFLFPNAILGIFSTDKVLISKSADFLKIIGISNIFASITSSYAFMLRGTTNVKLPTTTSMIALGLNTGLNYILIYGYFRLPAMGIKGSAIATLISRVLEFTLLISYIYFKKHMLAAKLSELTDISYNFFKNYLKTSLPVIINELIWSIGVSMYFIVYGRMGTETLAIMNITSTVDRILITCYAGFANAGGIMIGNKIGESKEEEVQEIGGKILKLILAIGIFIGLILFLMSKPITNMYNFNESVLYYTYINLIILASFSWIKGQNFSIIVGILRSGGDTKYSLIIDLSALWLIGIPLVFWAGLYLKLPIYYVYAISYLEELIKLFFGIMRYRSKKWINNVTAVKT